MLVYKQDEGELAQYCFNGYFNCLILNHVLALYFSSLCKSRILSDSESQTRLNPNWPDLIWLDLKSLICYCYKLGLDFDHTCVANLSKPEGAARGNCKLLQTWNSLGRCATGKSGNRLKCASPLVVYRRPSAQARPASPSTFLPTVAFSNLHNCTGTISRVSRRLPCFKTRTLGPCLDWSSSSVR